eukprot:scaffold30431_cov31-Tisochrysis_lutea.AAC.6
MGACPASYTISALGVADGPACSAAPQPKRRSVRSGFLNVPRPVTYGWMTPMEARRLNERARGPPLSIFLYPRRSRLAARLPAGKWEGRRNCVGGENINRFYSPRIVPSRLSSTDQAAAPSARPPSSTRHPPSSTPRAALLGASLLFTGHGARAAPLHRCRCPRRDRRSAHGHPAVAEATAPGRLTYPDEHRSHYASLRLVSSKGPFFFLTGIPSPSRPVFSPGESPNVGRFASLGFPSLCSLWE